MKSFNEFYEDKNVDENMGRGLGHMAEKIEKLQQIEKMIIHMGLDKDHVIAWLSKDQKAIM